MIRRAKLDESRLRACRGNHAQGPRQSPDSCVSPGADRGASGGAIEVGSPRWPRIRLTTSGSSIAATLEGRTPERHGYPIRLPEMLVGFEGVAYLARGTVHTPTGVKKTKKLLRAALETQRRGLGFSLVEVVTMCPTGWFTTPGDGPKFQQENLLPVFPVGELKRPRDLTV